MLLDHAFSKPVGNTLAFALIAIDWPGFLTIFRLSSRVAMAW